MQHCVGFAWSRWRWRLWFAVAASSLLLPHYVVFAQPGRDCLSLCSGNFTCAMSCAACDFDCCSSTCAAVVGASYVCDPDCYAGTLNVTSCCGLPSSPPPLPAPYIPGPGNCSVVSIGPTRKIVEGIPLVFNITGIDSNCSGVNCSCATPFTGSPFYFQVMVINPLTGNIPPKTACTIGNSSSSGLFPISCLAQNAIADATTLYSLSVKILSYGTWVSSIGFVSPLFNMVAGPVYVPACTATWFNQTSTFIAGTVAKFYIVQMDAYGNVVSNQTGSTEAYSFVFSVIASPAVNTSIYFDGFAVTKDIIQGNQTVTFYPKKSGSFYLQIGNQSQVIQKSPFHFTVLPGPLSINDSAAYWPNGINTFDAGSTAALSILQVDQYLNPITVPLLTVTIYFMDDNSNAGLNVTMSILETNSDYLSASFQPVKAGLYLLHVGNGTLEIPNSPFLFSVMAGEISVQNCTGSWVGPSVFQAGAKASFRVLQMDAYNNNVSLITGSLQAYNFMASVINVLDGSSVPMTLTLQPAELGSAYRYIGFVPLIAGSFLLSVGSATANISMSPFPFQVLPGSLSIPDCMAWWPNGSTIIAGQIGGFEILKKDKYNNSVYDFYNFVGNVISYSTDIPVGSLPNFALQIQNVNGTDYNLVTFISTVSGVFAVVIGSSTDSIANSPVPFSINASSPVTSSCIASWPYQISKLVAGSEASLQILMKDKFNNTVTGGYDPTFQFMASVSDTYGIGPLPGYNTTFASNTDQGLSFVKFYPNAVGNYLLNVWGPLLDNVTGSPFPFSVTAGPISVTQCTASWLGNVSTFQAGTQAVIQILLMDKFGNNVSAATGRNDSYNFIVEVVDYPDALSTWNVTVAPQNFSGYQSIIFYPVDAGDFLLRIGSKTKNISGSPFLLNVNPGSLSIPDSYGEWLNDIPYFLQNATVEFLIYPSDAYANAISSAGLDQDNFTALVYFATNLTTYPTPNFTVTPYDDYTLLMTFAMTNVGKYILQVGDLSQDIGGSPFIFTVTSDQVDPLRTVLEGSGLRNSTAGNISNFLVQLRDSSGYPAATNITDVSVSFLKSGQPIDVGVNISVIPKACGAFQISYLPFYVGEYQIIVKWKGVVLGTGPAVKKYVLPASIYGPWCSGTASSTSVAEAGSNNYFYVTTVDVYNNTNPSGPVAISVSFTPPAYETKTITKNWDGTFTITYNISMSGQYFMTVLVGSTNATQSIIGSPFEVDIISGPVVLRSCRGKFQYGNVISLGRPIRFFVLLRDKFDNGVIEMKDNALLEQFQVSVYPSDNSTDILKLPDLTLEILGTSTFISDKMLVSFTLQELGDFVLQVGDGTYNIIGGPFPFLIVSEAPSLFESNFTGNGLENTTAGEDCFIFVTLRDEFGQPVVAHSTLLVVNLTLVDSTTLATTIEAEVYEVNITQGQFVANYTATIVGEYEIDITWSGSPIATFFKTIFPGPSFAEGCVGYGAGLHGGTAGADLIFNVTVFDAYGNENPGGAISFGISFEPVIEDNVNITSTFIGAELQVTYSVRKARSYSLNVIAISEIRKSIPGSPFSILITAGPLNANLSTVIGEGVSPLASIYKWNEIIVAVTDSYGNSPTIDLALFQILAKGPGTSTYLSFKPLGGGSYSSSYMPSVVGSYNVSVLYQGSPIAGSPYNVTVGTTTQTARDFYLQISPKGPVVAGTQLVKFKIASTSSDPTAFNFTMNLVSSLRNRTGIGTDNINGSRMAVLNITEAASYNVLVSLYGSLITGSYWVTVLPGALYVKKCIADVPTTAKVNVSQKVTVQGRDRFANNVTTSVDATGASVTFSMILTGPSIKQFQLTYQAAGVYVGTFVTSKPGIYDLEIMSGDTTQLEDSPFAVIVS